MVAGTATGSGAASLATPSASTAITGEPCYQRGHVPEVGGHTNEPGTDYGAQSFARPTATAGGAFGDAKRVPTNRFTRGHKYQYGSERQWRTGPETGAGPATRCQPARPLLLGASPAFVSHSRNHRIGGYAPEAI